MKNNRGAKSVRCLLDFLVNIPWLQVNKYEDPRDACAAIARESYKLWLEHESRTDDITIIIVHIKRLD